MALPEIIKDIDARIIRPTSTDNAIVRFDGTTGQVQNTANTIDDNNNTIINGSLYIPAKIIGYSSQNIYNLRLGPSVENHIDLGCDGIQAKIDSSNTASTLYLNFNGGEINIGGNLTPKTDNALNLGSNGYRFKNIYSFYLHLQGSSNPWLKLDDGSSNTWYIQSVQSENAMGFGNGWDHSLKIYNNGNVIFPGSVGIGITSPSYKLHVNGTACITDTLTSSYHNFIVSGNEFNFLPESYGNSLWLNYVSGVSRNRTTNALTDYYFGNGQGAATTTLHASTFDGNAKTATLAMSSKDTGHASYRTTSSTSYILVRIKSAQSYWMTAFTLRVYQGYNHYDVTFSGYQYGANYWYSPKATLSSSTIANLTVYFGYISQAEMWVAIPGGDYTGAKILNVVNGYYNFTDIANAFTIENATSLPGTIQSTQTIYRPWIRGEAVTGAVWNDYAEYRESDFIEPGYCLIENGDDTLSKSTERMQPWAGISSDTWGFAQGQTEKAQTPIAVAGRVLVYPYRDRNEYKSGDCVCTAPDGKIDIMTEEEIYKHPDKIIGVVSCVPDYEEWGGGENADRLPVKVDGRIWIRVK